MPRINQQGRLVDLEQLPTYVSTFDVNTAGGANERLIRLANAAGSGIVARVYRIDIGQDASGAATANLEGFALDYIDNGAGGGGAQTAVPIDSANAAASLSITDNSAAFTGVSITSNIQRAVMGQHTNAPVLLQGKCVWGVVPQEQPLTLRPGEQAMVTQLTAAATLTYHCFLLWTEGAT